VPKRRFPSRVLTVPVADRIIRHVYLKEIRSSDAPEGG
jgi:hypothetical protein